MSDTPANAPSLEEDAKVTSLEEPAPSEIPGEVPSPSRNVPEYLSSARHSRRVALVGIYAALILALDYIPRPPNVEFMTCLLFVAGYCFGTRVGGFIAIVVSAIFSYANPLGPSQPTLFVFQVAFYMFVALLGSILGRIRQRRPFIIGTLGSAALGAIGFGITLLFDIGSTFAFGLPLTNWNWTAVWPIWFSGIAFTIIHVVSNAVIFAFLLPVIANAILTQYGSLFAESAREPTQNPAAPDYLHIGDTP